MERDRIKVFLEHIFIISTHTLTWSVTARPAYSGRLPIYFNSHAHVERDEAQTERDNAVKDFNSHAHVERDQV